jgi:hypothetical protein
MKSMNERKTPLRRSDVPTAGFDDFQTDSEVASDHDVMLDRKIDCMTGGNLNL